jgi:hypothetical protein
MRGWAAICALWLVGPVGPARADNATEARLHFTRGVEFYQAGRLEDALEQFLTSNRLAPNPNVVFNVAQCLEELRRFDDAYTFYDEYLATELSPEDRAAGEARRAALLPRVARVRVESTPPGATILVDRRELGTFGVAPRTLAVPAGSHRLFLELPGYLPAEATCEAVRGEQRVVAVELRPRVGQLRVTTEPTGARLLVDGAPAAEPAAELALPVGSHRLRAELDGRLAAEELVEVREGETLEVALVLPPAPPPLGRLAVVANVPGALVRLDDQEAGFAPMVVDVPAGPHRLLVQAEDRMSWLGEFAVGEDDRAWAAVQLEPLEPTGGPGIWPWLVTGLGGAALAAAAVTGGLALDARFDYEADPTRETLALGRELNVATDGLLGAGLVAAAAGLIWYFAAQPPPPRPSSGEISVLDGELEE